MDEWACFGLHLSQNVDPNISMVYNFGLRSKQDIPWSIFDQAVKRESQDKPKQRGRPDPQQLELGISTAFRNCCATLKSTISHLIRLRSYLIVRLSDPSKSRTCIRATQPVEEEKSYWLRRNPVLESLIRISQIRSLIFLSCVHPLLLGDFIGLL
ncbi:hypothetical protein YC2023_010029 [Brassica napus]